MTPHERLNEIAKLLDIPDRLNQDSGVLARDHLLTKILLHLAAGQKAQELMRTPRPVLSMPKVVKK